MAKLCRHDFGQVASVWPMPFMTRTNEARTASALTAPASHQTRRAILWASARVKG